MFSMSSGLRADVAIPLASGKGARAPSRLISLDSVCSRKFALDLVSSRRVSPDIACSRKFSQNFA